MDGVSRLVVEVLSPDTWRSDLGIGNADDVDRMRTYLEAGIPEYWVLNPGVEARSCPLPIRSGRFLSRAGDRWEEFEPEDGVLRSGSVPGLDIDLEAFWRESGI